METFATVERPWRNNEPFVSCIPEGIYPLVLGVFHRNTPELEDDYPSWEIHDVPGRTLVKMHRANRPTDVQGCVGVGKTHTDLGVAKSKVGYAEWMDAMEEIMGGRIRTEIEITWGW